MDTNGDVYLTGYFQDSIAFGSTTLYESTPGNTNSLFVAKFTAAGTPLWAVSATGTVSGLTIATDIAGNAVVSGSFVGTATFGSATLANPSNSLPDIFIAKLDAATGTTLWAVSAGSNGTDYALDVDIDHSGNIYLTGPFAASFVWGSATLTNATGNGFFDFFLVKLSPAGVLQWAVTAGGGQADVAYELDVDINGDVFIAGAFNSPSISFGSNTLTNSGTVAESFLARFSPSGTAVWACGLSGTSIDKISGMAFDGLGNIYTSGTYSGSALSAGPFTLTNTGGDNGFILKFNSAGIIVDTISFSGLSFTGALLHSEIALDAGNNIYIAGTYLTDLALDTFTLVSAGSQDIFVAKYGLPCMAAPALPGLIAGPATVCPAAQYTYSVPPVPNAASYIWTLPPGWTGTGSGSSINVTTTANRGTISVAAANACGTSSQQFKALAVSLVPNPVIVQSGLTLSTAAGQGSYQWFRNGSTITGATNNSHTVTQPGNYFVRVTNAANCTGQSNTIGILSVDIEALESNGLCVVPTPSNGFCTLEWPQAGREFELQVRDLQGGRVEAKVCRLGPQKIGLQLLNTVPGVYLLLLKQEGIVRTARILVASER